ncbi:MAG: phage tail assembly chaperone, partial [Comamonas sp.]
HFHVHGLQIRRCALCHRRFRNIALMEFFAHDKHGRIWQTGNCPCTEISRIQITDCTVRLGMAKIGEHYWCARRGLQKIPERPSQAHEFDYLAKAWVLQEAKAWVLVRAQRDQLMAASDWRVARAMEQGAPLGNEWVSYRQALRDVTLQHDPLRIEWPLQPE